MIVTAAVVAGVLGLVAIAAVVVENARVGLYAQAIEPALLANQQAARSMVQAQSAVRGFRMGGQAEFRSEFGQARASVLASTDRLVSVGTDARLDDLPEQERAAASRWLLGFGEPAVAGSLPEETSAERSAFQAFTSANEATTALLLHRSRQQATTSGWVTAVVIAIVVVTSAAGLWLVLGRGVRSQAAISPPLEALRRVIRRRSEGDLGVRADPEVGSAEVREVAAAFNVLMEASARETGRLADDARLATAVRQVGLDISRSVDIDGILHTSTRSLQHQFEAAVAWVRVFEGDADVPGDVSGAMHPAQAWSAPAHLQRIAQHAAGRAWAAQAAANLDPADSWNTSLLNLEEGRSLLEFVAEHAVVDKLLLVGVGAGEQCLGYLALGRTAGQAPFTDAEAAAAVDVGHYLGRSVLYERIYAGERRMVEQLRGLDEQKTDFLATVSHELRTPLASVIGHAELIRDEQTSPAAARSLTAIERNARRLEVLVEDLLMLSQVEIRNTEALYRPVELHQIIEDSANSYRYPAGTGLPQVDIRLAGEPVTVRANREELRRVVDNLIGNAVKFSPNHPLIEISTAIDDRAGVLTIADHGLGIPTHDLPHIFTRFFRSSSVAANTIKGTGLGLAITKMILDRHGATINVLSVLGQGTTITVNLPLAEQKRFDLNTHYEEAEPEADN